MDTDTHTPDVIIKKEPPESLSPLQDEDSNNISSNENTATADATGASNHDSGASDTDSKTSPHGSLRYISRRGRPPGGGYSMKPHSNYITFGTPSLMTSQDFGRQSALSQSSSALSPHDIMKTGLTSSLDALDTRRFGFHSFDSEKNSFRCEGCDVVFSSRDTYAMHMLLRAKNESCVALPTSAISSNPENPTPREKFERELREKAMLTALRNQAALMSKAAAAASVIPKGVESISALRRTPSASKDDLGLFGASDVTSSLSNILAFDTYGLYVDQRHYRRLLSEYGIRSPSTSGSLSAMMEQLSCSVCGELFTNKDALAMHMMFHTRDVENEIKPIVSWRPDAAMHAGHNFSLTDLESIGRNSENFSQGRRPDNEKSNGNRQFTADRITELKRMTENNDQGKRQENVKTNGDRQLTAERIAELKRMAIESSLRSSLKKHAMNQDKQLQSTRPKSVSEDMVVTSSAQTRPLSADDAIKISNYVHKGVYKPHKTTSKWETTHGENDEDSTPRTLTRKRNLSVSEDSSVDYLSSFSGAYSRRKQFRYDSSSFDTLAQSNQYFRSVLNQEREKHSKVCDNHVSSASGPQDSDETSDGSSSVTDHGREENSENRRQSTGDGEESSPSLETIMSSDTVLVPVENMDDVPDDEKDIRERNAPNNSGMNNSEISAIDFSVGKRDSKGGEEHSTDEGTLAYSRTAAADPHHNRYHSNDTSFRYVSSEAEDEANRQLYNLQQHYVELIPGGEAGGQRLVTRTASLSPLVRGSDANGNSSSDSVAEASSRVGEARYCPHCEILFLDVTLFHLHMGLHNVNNPWQCNTCGMVCGGRLEFNTHVLHY